LVTEINSKNGGKTTCTVPFIYDHVTKNKKHVTKAASTSWNLDGPFCYLSSASTGHSFHRSNFKNVWR